MVHRTHDAVTINRNRKTRQLSRVSDGVEGLPNRAAHLLYIETRGAVSIEMVFFLLIFVVTFFGAVEMAREISVKHALDVGTYRAARYLSLVPNDQPTARNMIQKELDTNVLGRAGTVQMVVDMPSQSFQTIFSVTAQVPYQPVVPLVIFAPKSLSVTHSQSIEAYP